MSSDEATTPSNEQSLEGLVERVKAATGPDRELEVEIIRGLLGYREAKMMAIRPDAWKLMSSIDAALALVDRKLPGWWVHGVKENRTPVTYRGGKHMPLGWCAGLQHVDGGRLTQADAASAPLAILAALLAALKDASE